MVADVATGVAAPGVGARSSNSLENVLTDQAVDVVAICSRPPPRVPALPIRHHLVLIRSANIFTLPIGLQTLINRCLWACRTAVPGGTQSNPPTNIKEHKP